MELVNFRFSDIRGQFNHNGTINLSIVCNYTNNEDLIRTTVEIGVYCRYNFCLTKAKNRDQMRMEARRLLMDELDTFNNIKDGSVIGILRICQNTEFKSGQNNVYQLDHATGYIYIYNKVTKQ